MRSNTFTAISLTAFLVTSLAVGNSSNASAQSNVSVDLSVLSDGGYGSMQSGTMTGGALMMPGAAMPKSSYFGPAVTVTNPVPVATVTEPAPAAATPEPVLTAADAVPPPAPEPAPAPPVAAPEPVIAEVAPPAAPEPEITETPALPPEPEVVAQTTVATTEEANDASMEMASATPGPTELAPGRAAMVVFEFTQTKLPANSADDLDAIAATVRANEDMRIQLMAYAGGPDLTSSKARRVSLSRALAVRSYFIGQDVRSTRIDVRALGNKTDEEPINRVDVNITKR